MIVDDEDIIVSGLVKVMPWAKYGCEVAATASDGDVYKRQEQMELPF